MYYDAKKSLFYIDTAGTGGETGTRQAINAWGAEKTLKDSLNQQIDTTYIKGISIANNQLSYITGDGVSHSVSGTLGAVTGVKGSSETNYRTGNVNITKANIGLGDVENTKLSTWTGSANITTIGTLLSGTVPWVRLSDIPSASTNTAGIIQIGSGALNAAAGNHTHTTSLASDTGNAAITLSYNQTYKLTAGGTSVIFKTPASDNTNTTYTFVSGTNGNFTVTPSGGSAQTVSIGKPATAGVADSANAVAWSNVSGKPSSYTPSSHSHSEIVTVGDKRNEATTPNSYANKIVFQGLKTNSSFGSPSTDTYSYVVGLRGWSDSSGGDSHELAFNNTGLYWRHGATTSWDNWNRIYTTANKPTKSDVGLGNVENTALSTWAGSSNITTIGTLSSGTVPWARLSNVPTSMPASDVPAWAKASSKPTYSLSEITSADDLKAIEALTGTSGLLKKTAANTWTLDTNTYLTSHQSLSAYAKLASPAFTGTPTAPTAANGTNNTQIATTAFVMNAFTANDAMVFKGILGTESGMISSLPTTHSQGWTYKVGTAGTYAGQVCEVGDTIYCIADGTSANNAHWVILQTNVDGTVIGPAASTADHIATFTGTTGKVIKDSGFTIATSVPANAVFTDTTYSAGTGLSLSGTTINHSNSVVAKAVASQAAKTLTWNDTFTIYEETYDSQGHITGVINYNMTMPANPAVEVIRLI